MAVCNLKDGIDSSALGFTVKDSRIIQIRILEMKRYNYIMMEG